MSDHPVLAVSDLRVAFGRGAQARQVVRGLSFQVAAGETLAIVGESGSGKSVTALAIMGLLPKPAARLETGSIRLLGEDLVSLPAETLRRRRGERMAMVFQEPMTSLNPVLSIGRQMTEGLVAHGGASARAALAEAAQMLERVGIADAAECLRRYPHELSGGMRQRVMIAAAMMMRPALLIADEPTTALDVTVQAQILDLLRDLTRETGTALMLVTHDMGVVAEMADRVLVMRHGVGVEQADVRRLFAAPAQPYTRRLLAAVPRSDTVPSEAAAPVGGPPLLVTRDLSKSFGSGRLFGRGTPKRALDGVGFSLGRGEILAVVGESGSGKSTLGRAVARLIDVDAGSITFDGQDLVRLSGGALRRKRAGIQMIFQDPYASLDPRFTIGRTIAEPMLIHGHANRAEAPGRAEALLERVRLERGMAGRYPHEFSGGQRQRVAIARALAAEPQVIIADEPTSALDVSVQAQILDLLADLRARDGLSFLFISHDLAVVRRIADRVAVMRAGRILEIGPTEAVLQAPAHVYTRALLSAAPVPDPLQRERPRLRLPGAGYPAGPLVEISPSHWVAS
ncbi:ABC transporter ATP-binding protein [Prosthecodimorpha staleyi]|uniref:ABC transporter ATP-binding protein n=1 Tax=Prosthecodimorpha staleyi TaxID=2840188 RepID=A0A947D6A1_9HYPH|nr:ABC transporter ATP-binding protein [Prosthecodimorpha staleyi]MBT9290934.1 ABC transporter ATP-binding protein [Prosthecodimorpha staleyi]